MLNEPTLILLLCGLLIWFIWRKREWIRNRNTVEFLGLWETMNNTDFKGVEFDTFRKEAGLNSFTLTAMI